MAEAFVDVTYRGLEVGRRLKLCQVGPSTAYLEHPSPMPVGAAVQIATDEGLTIPAVVLRVHEQVAGAESASGMRVRAPALEGAAAAWWQKLVSREDPQIPEPQAAPPPVAPAGPPPIDQRPTVMMEAVAVDESEGAPPPPAVESAPAPVPAPAPAPEPTPLPVVVPEIEPPHGGNGSDPRSTTVMSAVEIKEAIGGVDPIVDADGGGEGGGNGEDAARGKRRRRRRR